MTSTPSPPAPALYYRLRRLWPLVFHPFFRRGLRWLGAGVLLAYFLFAGLILVLRYAVLPQIDDYRGEIEQRLSGAVGLPVGIGAIKAGWKGLDPRLELLDVRIADHQGRPAFVLGRVETALSWLTLWRGEPTLSLLALHAPVLHVRRDSAGKITVAGLDTEGESDPRLIAWILAQPHIRIRDATVVWEDALRAAPPLVLEDLQFALDNRGKRHRFGLTAVPPSGLASRLDVRGEVRGSAGQAFETLSGKLYADLDYADLAAWRSWMEYPLDLPRGHGALRLWADWAGGEGRLTTDLALEGVRVRLGKSLPELDLAHLSGRLSGRYRADGWEIAAQQLALTAGEGLQMAPTDFRLDWRQKPGAPQFQGKASATVLDLGALTRLAAYLPLDTRSRALLDAHRPEGRIHTLRFSWESGEEYLKRYQLSAHFDRLGLRASGHFPGAGGLSGDIEANELSGRLSLEARDAVLDLPAVFPESRLTFAEMRAKTRWTKTGEAVEAKLESMSFASPDAAGSAHGSYRFSGEGPGGIDLTATLSRANGAAVWRYMPHAVNVDARNWLKRGIVSGRADQVKLILKGDLQHFPFLDPAQGQFLITARAHEVKVDYAPGWPVIEGIEADLRFGVGMDIRASAGRILGTALGPVHAELPDFSAPEEQLRIQGTVRGPTAEFLKFIDQSPVSRKIDAFTEDMRAAGEGQLELDLDMPLRHVAETRVRGAYHFHDNQVTVATGLPPISQLNGRLEFTGDSVTAPEITGSVLGGPLRFSVKNDGGRVLVAMNGTANVKELPQIIDLPLLEAFSGSASWKGEMRIRKKVADFVIESNLAGVSSRLPEPLAKPAAASWPLRVEKLMITDSVKGIPRDRIRVSLGKLAEAAIFRHREGEAMLIERGAVGVGQAAPRLPDKGIGVAVSLAQVDADAWREALGHGKNAPGGGAAVPSIRQISLRTPSLRLFERNFQNVELGLKPRDAGWQIALNTREAEGEIFWNSAGEGWVQADLKRLVIPESLAAAGESSPPPASLPGMEIRVADFVLGNKRLGHLELKAKNEQSFWRLENLFINTPDGSLKGQGGWKTAGAQQSRLNFELAAKDAGKLLERLGHPGALRRGTALLKGDLTWDGPLTAIHYPSLTGQVDLHAEKGQFNKLDPGYGKLLGLLSMQSLPRRLSLDFNDIFSEGFAFDSIEGKFSVKAGVLATTDELKIDGPAARVLMKGSADIQRETQDVRVTVQPEIGSAVTLGAGILLVHPVAGVAAALANRILQKPLDKMFSIQYHVSGPWADPKVEKIGQTGKAAAQKSPESAFPGSEIPALPPNAPPEP